MQITELFFQRAREIGSKPALTFYCENEKKWLTKSWEEYLIEVQTLASWLKSPEGGEVKPGERVAIVSPNRHEWLVADLAILTIGAISVPIYPTSTLHDMSYIIEHADVKVIFTDTIGRIKGLLERNFRRVIEFQSDKEQFDGALENALHESYMSFRGILKTHKARLVSPCKCDPADTATIIYTSGTTGKPKGVVHTYGNFAWALKVDEHILLRRPEDNIDPKIYGTQDRFFSFLPLSHVAERILIEVGSILCGGEVFFARSIDTLAQDLVMCRPTIFMCVPRLWEKMHEKIMSEVESRGFLSQGIFKLALKAGSRRVQGCKIITQQSHHPFVRISDVLLGQKLRAKLGLDRCRILATGAAPMRIEVLKFFASIGLPIREVYGLTENFTFGTLNMPNDIQMGSCGVPFPYNSLKIAEDGEVLFKAPWMFKEYYLDPDATRGVLSSDGWFATGDLGEMDKEGRLRIVGRKKELIKTSGGKFVAPVPIENRFKDLPYIKEAVVVGDQHKYCVALVELDEDLSLSDEQISVKLQEYMQDINAGLASFESIKRIGVMRDSLTVANGLLTPTLKIRRSALEQKKAHFIRNVYEKNEQVVFEKYLA